MHRVRKKRGGGGDRGESGSTSTGAGQGVSDSYMGHYQYMPYMHPGDPSAAGGYAYGCALCHGSLDYLYTDAHSHGTSAGMRSCHRKCAMTWTLPTLMWR